MSELQLIDDVFGTMPQDDIIQRRKNPIIALLIGLAGTLLTIWSITSPVLAEQNNLSSMLMMGGSLIALVGFIKGGMTLRSTVPVYKPTGERIQRFEFFYKSTEKSALCASVNAADFKRLVSIPRTQQTSGLLLTLYATRSGSFAFGQVLQYVPHAFEPVTPAVGFSAESEVLMAQLV